MSDDIIPTVSFGKSEFFVKARETFTNHRDSNKYGEHQYDRFMALFFKAIEEAQGYAYRLGWEGCIFTYGHAVRPRDALKAAADPDGKFEFASLTFSRTGAGPSRTFTVTLWSDFSITTRV